MNEWISDDLFILLILIIGLAAIFAVAGYLAEKMQNRGQWWW